MKWLLYNIPDKLGNHYFLSSGIFSDTLASHFESVEAESYEDALKKVRDLNAHRHLV